jgi:small subunit ribosomal protein S9
MTEEKKPAAKKKVTKKIAETSPESIAKKVTEATASKVEAPKIELQRKPRVSHKPKIQGYQGTGRRKTAIVQVRLTAGKGAVTVNGKTAEVYFSNRHLLLDRLMRPLEATGNTKSFDVIAFARGGGIASQADALRLGIARALLEVNVDLRKKIKPLGLLTRDPRAKERKKYGRKRARKRFQYSKR